MALQLLDLSTSQTPWELELRLRALDRFDDSDRVRVILAADPIAESHRDGLAFAILAAALKKFSVEVRIDTNKWSNDALTTVRHTPAGLLGLFRATSISNNSNEQFPDVPTDRIRSIAVTQKGILEPDSLRGRSFTYVAIDPENDRLPGYPIPRILDGDLTKEAFSKDLGNVIRNSFGLGHGLQRNVDSPKVRHLVQCVYEIFKNTHDHARRTANDFPICGIRYLQIRKRIDTSPARLARAAEGFDELKGYLQSLARDSRAQPVSLIEINIGDCGEGILEHFMSIRAADNGDLPRDRLTLLAQIVATNLTSSEHANAGYGLGDALKSAAALNGFVSLRVDRFWLHRSYHDARRPEMLYPTKQSERGLEPIQGTHFSIVVPWTDLAPLR